MSGRTLGRRKTSKTTKAEADAAAAAAASTDATFVSGIPCAVCSNSAVLRFTCGGCKSERCYCQTYSCQYDDWSQHQNDCTALMNSIYKEDTTITRLNDQSTWERRRRRSVDVEFQERVPIMDINAAQIIRPDMEGYLANPGDSLQNWKLRWFLLKDDLLMCFENEKSFALGGILANGYQVRSADEELKEKYSIKLYRTDGPAHYFVAQSRDDCNTWIKAFAHAAALNNDITGGEKGSTGLSGTRRSNSNVSISFSPETNEAKATRSILLRNIEGSRTIRNNSNHSLFGGSDRLVRIRPTDTLCDAPLPEDTHNTMSRSAALSRILAQPASYPRNSIRLMALELGSTKLSHFASQRNSGIASFFKRSAPRRSSNPELHRSFDSSSSDLTAAANAITSARSTGALTSPKTRRSLNEVNKEFSASKTSMDSATGRNSPTNTFKSDDSESKAPSSVDEIEFDLNSVGSTVSRSSRSGGIVGASSSSGAAYRSREALNVSPGGSLTLQRPRSRPDSVVAQATNGWGGPSPGQARRRSIVFGIDGAPPGPLVPPLLATGGPIKALQRQNSFESEGGSSQAAESSLDRPSFLEGFLERIMPNGDIIKLWFVLDDFYMRAYESEESVVCVLEVDLEGCSIDEDDTTGFTITHGEHSLHVRAYDVNDRMQWLNVINEMRDYFILQDEPDQEEPLNGEEKAKTVKRSQSGVLAETEEEFAFQADLDRLVEDIRKFSITILQTATSQENLSSPTMPRPSHLGQPPTVEALNRLQLSEDAKLLRSPTAAVNNTTADNTITPATPTNQRASDPNTSTATDTSPSSRLKRRRPTILLPMNGLTDGQLWKPGEAVALTADEIKNFAVKTGTSQEEAGAKTVMYQQNGEDVVLQFENGENGQSNKYTIAAGTLDQLVSRLADENTPDSNFIDIFLLTYRHITSPAALIDRLISRFYLVPPENSNPEQLAYFERWSGIIQVRTIGVVKKWTDHYYVDFHSDPEAYQGLEDFLNLAEQISPGLTSLVQRLRGIIAQKKEAILAQEAIEKTREPPKKTKVEFLQLEPREVARQLTLIDHSKFQAIHPVEFAIRLWEGNGTNTKNLTAFIDWFNRISFFVATLICVQPHVKKRANIVENFIKVGKELLRLRNYNSSMAILSGLNNASVRRLKKTWAIVPPKSMEALQQIETTMSSAYNYRNYRELMNEMDRLPRPEAVVPFMGLFLRDLTFINDGNPKKFKGGLYNFGKLRMVAQRVLRLQAYQAANYSFPLSRNAAMVKEFLENPNAMTDENALYKCSLLCEPRDDGSQPVRLIEKWSKESGGASNSGTDHSRSKSQASVNSHQNSPKSAVAGIAADPTMSVVKKKDTGSNSSNS